MELKDRIFDLKLKGYCCSQIIVALALEDLEKENEDLIKSMGGFCEGLEIGESCGTLLASIVVLYMIDAEAASNNLRQDFMDWFHDIYGSFNCRDIVGDDPQKKMDICPSMIEASYEMLKDLLEGELGD